MKKLVRQVVLLLCPAIQDGISVLMVPQNRMADRGEMGADLMGPARHQQDFEKGQFPVAVPRRVLRLDGQRILANRLFFHSDAVGGLIFHEIALDPGFLLHLAFDQAVIIFM